MREISYHHESGSLPRSLQKVPFLHGLDSHLVDKLLGDAALLECDPGDTIISEGDRSKYLCILLKGAMDIIKDGNKVNTLCHSGEMLGELALVADTARTATVVASKHSFCLKIQPQFLGELSETERNGFYAALYKFVSKILGERLQESSKKIAQLEHDLRELGGGTSPQHLEPATYKL